MTRWTPAYVALGSNLDDPERQIEAAFRRLDRLMGSRLLARSRLYLTRPLGPQEQPDFLNAAAGLLTQHSAPALLAELQDIERTMGRVRPPVRWGARRIDLDLHLWGDAVVDSPGLTLPHPGLLERNFVLHPLADIAPTLYIRGHGTVARLAQRLGTDGLRLYNTA